MTFKEIESLLQNLKEKNVMRLSITGGEPFIRSDMLDILELASNMGFEIYISTNGTFNQLDFTRFRNLKIQVIQISLDGLGEKHDNIRGQKGAFNKSIEFIKRVKEANTALQIGVAFTLMKKNVNDLIELYEYLKQLPINIFSVIPVQRIGRSTEEYALDSFELQSVLQKVADYYCTHPENIDLNLMLSPALVPEILRGKAKYGQGYICTFPYSLAVSANGVCSLCDGLLDEMNYQLCNYKEGIENMFKHNAVREVINIDTSQLTGVCSKCKLNCFCAGGCRADAYLSTGSFLSSDIMCQSYYDNGLFPVDLLKENDYE